MITDTIKCNNCGKEFYGKYYEGGSIEHNNWTNDWNMGVGIGRGINYIVNHLDMREDNKCDIKNMTIHTQSELIKCQKIWLEKHGHMEYVEAIDFYFDEKQILLNKIFELQPEFLSEHFNRYVLSQNNIIDFYKKHNLDSKKYTFVEIESEAYEEYNHKLSKTMIGVSFDNKVVIVKIDR